MTDSEGQVRKDWANWAGNRRSYVLAWGLPTALLIIAIFLPAPIRTAVWSGALIWKGLACLANATRCGRRHCYLTGPFFLIMAAATLVHGTGAIPFGTLGWLWIGVGIALGTVVLWVVPESLWGKYVTRRAST